jgi:hypothetical protein
VQAAAASTLNAVVAKSLSEVSLLVLFGYFKVSYQ